MSRFSLEMRFQVPLDDFALTVDCRTSQRVVGLFGPSGSGKTTWLETLGGLRRGATGVLRFGEETWLDSDEKVHVAPERRGIGYVPQDHLLFPHLNVRQNLVSGQRRAEREGRDTASVFQEVVDVLELASLLVRDATSLSGGERQRVALGRALCSGPRLLMLDEPLASLDLQLRRRILPFLLRVRDRFQIPMMVVSHNPVELQALCGEVMALRRGRVVAQGAPDKVFTDPEVYTTAAAEGYENVLPAIVSSHGEHTTTVRVGEDSGGQVVSLLRANQAVGESVLLGIPAHDILVATKRMEGISARNFLTATIQRIEVIDHKHVLSAQLTGMALTPMVIELTQDAVEELTLETGSKVYLIIKSSSIAVYG